MTYREQYYQTLKKSSLCVNCKKPMPEGDTRAKCDKCRALEQERQRQEYKRRVENHLCARCGMALPADDSHKECEVCRAKSRKRAAIKKGKGETIEQGYNLRDETTQYKTRTLHAIEELEEKRLEQQDFEEQQRKERLAKLAKQARQPKRCNAKARLASGTCLNCVWSKVVDDAGQEPTTLFCMLPTCIYDEPSTVVIDVERVFGLQGAKYAGNV